MRQRVGVIDELRQVVQDLLSMDVRHCMCLMRGLVSQLMVSTTGYTKYERYNGDSVHIYPASVNADFNRMSHQDIMLVSESDICHLKDTFPDFADISFLTYSERIGFCSHRNSGKDSN